jgi:MFS family permease
MSLRSIVALGIGQCVSWGVLYYAFGVLLIPMHEAMATPQWIVTGAFSLALLVGALAAPTIGALSDRGMGRQLIRHGGIIGALSLLLLAAVPSVAVLYGVWGVLGLCMAATLYEPAFVIVGQAISDSRARLRALAIVTLFGGLASTVFMPVTARLTDSVGWRLTVASLACVLAISSVVSTALSPSDSETTQRLPRDHAPAPRGHEVHPVLAVVSFSSLASAAFSTSLIPALAERHVPTTTAALLGGLLGVMQLPGRAMLLNSSVTASPATLLGLSLACQSAGFALLAVARSLTTAAIAISLFALGSGLMTLVRPYAIQALAADTQTGYLNGVSARYQQLARAAGPVVAVGVAGWIGFDTVFALLAILMLVVAAISYGMPFESQPNQPVRTS